jgi:hypothetical protein
MDEERQCSSRTEAAVAQTVEGDIIQAAVGLFLVAWASLALLFGAGFAALVISDRRQGRAAPAGEDPERRRGAEAMMALAALVLSGTLAGLFTAFLHGI